MKTKSYRIMIIVILAAALLITGLLVRGSAGRWFGGRGRANSAVVTEIEGEVSVLRSGMAYTLKPDIGLRKDDAVTAGRKAHAALSLPDGIGVLLDADSALMLNELVGGSVRVEVTDGAAVFEMPGGGENGVRLQVESECLQVEAAQTALFSLEAYPGTVTVSVFEGTPVLRYGERECGLIPGDRVVLMIDDAGQLSSLSFSRVMASDLRELVIEKLMERGGGLFEQEQLAHVLETRRADTEQTAVAGGGESLACTLEIRCDTVLDHLDELLPETAALVPEDGVILPAENVAISEGDSVFDVLRRACLTAGVDLEYDYAYNLSGFYVTGISGLTERGCGPQSGWMYKVNGWFPNYGSSRCPVSSGDVIVWCYSCEGFGTDVGAEPWQSVTPRGDDP
ncbi:MAG: DUF4430 domain-containing protein [Oscillospiraceae bacterium]|nr:DUF4430 domain-containing protein [Oscillospiraceae bacterium]